MVIHHTDVRLHDFLVLNTPSTAASHITYQIRDGIKRSSPICCQFPCEFGKDFWKGLLNTAQRHLDQIKNPYRKPNQILHDVKKTINHQWLSSGLTNGPEKPGQKGY